MAQKEAPKRPKLPVQDVLVLTELEQIKVLADPLRVRILEALVEERTTKQVAERLGEKPTRLYHHVEALERIGLIRLTRTQPNRGTLEKYYQAVARSFRADSSIFRQSEEADSEHAELRQAIRTVMDSTTAELENLLRAGCGSSLEDEGALCYVEIRATREDFARIQKRVTELLDWLTKLGEEPEEDDEAQERYRLTLALFPLAREKKADGGGE